MQNSMPKFDSQNTSIVLLKHEMSEVNKHIDKLETSMDEGFEAIHAKLDGMIEKNDTRYASKWVEKGLISVGSLIILGVVGALLKLIIKS